MLAWTELDLLICGSPMKPNHYQAPIVYATTALSSDLPSPIDCCHATRSKQRGRRFISVQGDRLGSLPNLSLVHFQSGRDVTSASRLKQTKWIQDARKRASLDGVPRMLDYVQVPRTLFGRTDMPTLALHHVSIITANLRKSLPFYCKLFGLYEIPRPDFPVGELGSPAAACKSTS